MSRGTLYIVRNPLFPTLVKIGITSKNSVEERKLSNTSVPEDFETIVSYRVDHVEKLEATLHKLFDTYRHTATSGRTTEFFYVKILDDLMELLDSFNIKEEEETEGDQYGSLTISEIAKMCGQKYQTIWAMKNGYGRKKKYTNAELIAKYCKKMVVSEEEEDLDKIAEATAEAEVTVVEIEKEDGSKVRKPKR